MAVKTKDQVRISVRLPKSLKNATSDKLAKHGITLPQAIKMLCANITNFSNYSIFSSEPDKNESDKYSPVPTKDTLEAIKEAKDPKELKKLKTYHSVKDLMRDLNA